MQFKPRTNNTTICNKRNSHSISGRVIRTETLWRSYSRAINICNTFFEKCRSRPRIRNMKVICGFCRQPSPGLDSITLRGVNRSASATVVAVGSISTTVIINDKGLHNSSNRFRDIDFIRASTRRNDAFSIVRNVYVISPRRWHRQQREQEKKEYVHFCEHTRKHMKTVFHVEPSLIWCDVVLKFFEKVCLSQDFSAQTRKSFLLPCKIQACSSQSARESTPKPEILPLLKQRGKTHLLNIVRNLQTFYNFVKNVI